MPHHILGKQKYYYQCLCDHTISHLIQAADAEYFKIIIKIL